MVVVIFHSIHGLRAVEAAAAKLRSIGYPVVLLDRSAGAASAGDVESGFALMERVGWATRAHGVPSAPAE